MVSAAVDDQSNEWSLVVWGAIATVFGVAAVWHTISAWRLARRARTWPTTNGVITSSEITHEEGHYFPRVVYRYEVDGAEFIGTTVSPGGPTGANWESPARRVVKKYPSGKRVLVYYDPRKPAKACLERKVGFGVVVFFVFGIVFGLPGLIVLVAFVATILWPKSLMDKCIDSIDVPNPGEAAFNICFEVATSETLPDAERAQAYANIGVAFWGLERVEDALGAYRRAVSLDPTVSWFRSDIGMLLYELGRVEEALEALHEALRMEPNLGLNHSNLSHILNHLGRYEDGLKAADEAIRLDPPGDGFAHASKAWALSHLRRHREALEAAQEGVRLAKNNAEMWAVLGFAENLVGSYRESARAFEKALELDPSLFEHKDPDYVALLKAYEASRQGHRYEP